MPCIVVTEDDLRAELAMIDENLCRAALSNAEKAVNLRRRKELYLILHTETAQGLAGALAKHGSANDKLSFAQNTAGSTGQSVRSVERHVARAEKLGDDFLARVEGACPADRFER